MLESITSVQSAALKSETALYTALAASDTTVTLGSSESDPEQQAQLGKAIFEDYLETLKPKLCQNQIVHSANSNPSSVSETEVIAAIIDTILTVMGAVPVLVLAALVVKYGVGKLCHD